MTNPFKDSTKKMQRAESNEGLDLAVVEQVDDDERHIVFVRVLSATSEGTVSGEPTPVGVAVPTSGDVNVPSVGDLVVIGRFKGRRPVIIGTVHSQGNAVPTYTAGERVLGHTSTDAQIRFKNDGTIAIDSDGSGDVLINGSSVSGSGYGDEDAQDAVGTILSGNFTYDDVANSIDLSFDPATQTELNTHAGNASAHHSRYTDAEAVSAVAAADDYVKNTGDAMTGDLDIGANSFKFSNSSAIGSDQNGSIELGGNNSVPNTTGNRPYIDFHAEDGGTATDFTARIIAVLGGGLDIDPQTGKFNVLGTITAQSVEDSSGNTMLQNVAATGQVTLSSGSAVVNTGISTTDATFMLAIGVDDPNADTKVAGRLFWDDSAGTYKVEIVEQDTAVGNPTVNYDVIRVR